VSSTERVRKWRAEQRRKAQLYDQLEAKRRAHLVRRASWITQIGCFSVPDEQLQRALDDPFCFDIRDKA
jgi:hypothetical protein